MITGTTLEIRSDGTFVRDYVYVKDVVRGYLLLLEKMDQSKGHAFNLSSGESYTVLEVIKIIEKTLKEKISYSILNTQKNEIPHQSLNFDKVKKLGFAPAYTLKRVLPNILDWYRNIL